MTFAKLAIAAAILLVVFEIVESQAGAPAADALAVLVILGIAAFNAPGLSTFGAQIERRLS